MSKRGAAALEIVTRWASRPVVQDTGLAVVAVVSTVILTDAFVALPKMAGPGFEGPIVPNLQVWWLATVGCGLAILIRRVWPFPALVIGLFATVVHMAVIAGPVPADLAAPLALYVIATRHHRGLAVWSLAMSMIVVAGWSLYIALDGQADGWFFKSAKEVVAPLAPGGPVGELDIEVGPDRNAIDLGPTDWGGVPILGSVLVTFWAVGRSARSRRAYLDELTARARDLERERDQQAALSAAAERSRITRELHDVVAHGLSVIVMQAQGGIAAFGRRPQDTLAALHTVVETGRASLVDMRQVLAATDSVDESRHPMPGLDRLPNLIDQVRQAGTNVQLHIEGTPTVLPTTVDLSAYRIIQEALTNTMKHAGRRAVAQIFLSYGKNQLRVEVNDNGKVVPRSDGAGNGLRGMRERVALSRGEFVAGPGPNGGFVVRALLPITDGAEA